MIWSDFLLGSNFLFFSFKLIIIFCHTETLRIKMNRNVYFLSSAFRFYYTRVKLHAQNLRATRVEFPRISRAWRACRCCSTRGRYCKIPSFSLQLQHRREEDDRFATIRPQNLIARQHQEHNRQGDEMRDQLEVYKKLRQNHQKEVLILESRLSMEMNDHRRNLDKEYDQQVQGKHRTWLTQGLNKKRNPCPVVRGK